MRAFFLELTTPAPGQEAPSGARIWWARQIVNTVAQARADGVRPDEPAAIDVVLTMFGDADLGEVLASLEAGIDAGAEEYRELVSQVRGERSAPNASEELRWLATAMRNALAGGARQQ